MRTVYLSFLLLLLWTSLNAQSKNIKSIIETRMENRDYWFPDSLLQNPEFQRRIIPELEDVSKNILQYPHEKRDRFYWALVDLYRQNPDLKSKGKIIELLLLGCLDRSEWLRLNNMHDIVGLAHAEDFNTRRLEMLKALILHPTLHTTPLFPLVGKLDWPDGDRMMRNFFQNGAELLPEDEDRPGGYRASPKWRAAMALAKKGDKPAMAYLLQKAKPEKDRDALYLIFQDFAYIRTHESVDFLVDYLFSDGGQPPCGVDCLSETDFSSASMELTNLVKGFREFTQGTGDEKAIRSWMQERRTTYEILPEK